jgi:hypothetical protein
MLAHGRLGRGNLDDDGVDAVANIIDKRDVFPVELSLLELWVELAVDDELTPVDVCPLCRPKDGGLGYDVAHGELVRPTTSQCQLLLP